MTVGALRVPKTDLTAPLETASFSGSENPLLGMWHFAQDCPGGFERVVSKNNFFPKSWEGLRTSVDVESIVDSRGVSTGFELHWDNIHIRLTRESMDMQVKRIDAFGRPVLSIVWMDALRGIRAKTAPKIELLIRSFDRSEEGVKKLCHT